MTLPSPFSTSPPSFQSTFILSCHYYSTPLLLPPLALFPSLSLHHNFLLFLSAPVTDSFQSCFSIVNERPQLLTLIFQMMKDWRGNHLKEKCDNKQSSACVHDSACVCLTVKVQCKCKCKWHKHICRNTMCPASF